MICKKCNRVKLRAEEENLVMIDMNCIALEDSWREHKCTPLKRYGVRDKIEMEMLIDEVADKIADKIDEEIIKQLDVPAPKFKSNSSMITTS